MKWAAWRSTTLIVAQSYYSYGIERMLLLLLAVSQLVGEVRSF